MSITDLLEEIQNLRLQLNEANDTIEAIRNGEIDAFVVEGINGQELYTLHSADRTYRTFIERMSEGALTLNSHSLIVFSNSSFSQLVGLNSEDVIANSIHSYVLEDDHETLSQLIEKGWKQDVKGEI